MSDYAFEIPSKEEMDNQPREGREPLVADDYIIKLAKISLVRKASYGNKAVMEPAFQLIGLVYSMKDGEPLSDVTGNEVPPLVKWIFRDVSFSLGFSKDSPSFLRALLAYMEGIDVGDKLKVKKPLLLDPKGYESRDEEVLKRVLEDVRGEGDGETLKKGYKVVPDIRIYEGKYIACSLEIDKKKTGNKLIRFSKLPKSFQAPDASVEEEPMKKFEEGYAGMINKNKDKGQTGMNNNYPVQQQEIVNESLDMEVPEF